MHTVRTAIFLLAAIATSFLATEAQALTIVAFGDSTTAPVWPFPIYPDLLQNELPSILGQPITVVNAGVGGNTTVNALARLSSDVLSRNPDYVLIQFGVNDAFMDNGALGPRVPLANYIANTQSMIDRIKATGAAPILLTPVPLDYLIRFTALTFSGYHQLQGWNAVEDTYVEALHDLGLANGVPVIPINETMQALLAANTRDPAYLEVDYVHPNALGHRLEADLIEAGFTQLIPFVPEPGSLTLAMLAAVLFAAWQAHGCRRVGQLH